MDDMNRSEPPDRVAARQSGSVTLLLTGDVMTGRGTGVSRPEQGAKPGKPPGGIYPPGPKRSKED
ncbi:hypothetical protein LDC_2423 [sediment metagenome]|uniref:Uncharacterized protein n=1 Tax=sediment metagenome TaxID=749907 RepID=D9PLK0_9ZZZZ